MDRLPHDLPIEDLSERSWSRVEDAVFQELDTADADVRPRVVVETPRRPLWRPLLGITAVGAAAAVAGFVLLAGDSDDPSAPAPAQPQRIATADDSSQITAGEATLDVAPRSALVMSGDDDRGRLVVLERGSVECAVAPRKGRPPFTVQAGAVRVEVVGTRFAVTRDGDSAVVEVMKGTVRVTADGETTMVTAGEAWLAPAALEEIEEFEEIELSEVATAPEPAVRPKRKHPKRRRVQRRKPAPAPEPVPAAPAPPTARQLFERASSLEPTDTDAAIAIYRRLSRRGGQWAPMALFARARLEHDRGNKRTAVALLRRYLKRYPGGPNAADARYLLGQVER